MSGLLEIQLQPLHPHQLEQVVELDRLCLGGIWTLAGYQRELASPNSKLLGLSLVPSLFPLSKERSEREGCSEEERQDYPDFLIGLGCFWQILEEAHITLLMVHPDYQGKGLGNLLLYALLREAVGCGLARATLEVRDSNQAALSLYQKFGFKIAGRRQGYYQETGEDALILWRSDLAQAEFLPQLAIWQQQVGDRLAQNNWIVAHLRNPISSCAKEPVLSLFNC